MLARKLMQRQPGQAALNITSLMDILTIILIFLILSFSSEEAELEAPAFPLPASSSERPVKLAVKVSLSAESLRVEDQPVATLSGGRFRAADLDASRRVLPLLEELRRHKARLAAGAAPTPAAGDDEREIIYLEAAKGMRYDTIDRVLETAAAAGFVRFRLAVERRG